MPTIEKPVVSVCMATYNGAEYVTDQLESILEQLGPVDEIIVVDDASKDGTPQIVQALNDPRIRVIPSTVNRGYVSAFERAITESRGTYIMLSDQDDIWLPGRVAAMTGALKDNWFVASNFSVFGGEPNRFHRIQLRSRDSHRRAANIFATWVGYRPYYGCAMAFRGEAKQFLLPFPPFLDETHDQWLAMVGNLHRQMVHIEEPTVTRRLHDQNATPKTTRPIKVILRARIMMLRALTVAVARKYKCS
jgi:glycosyltransferase involved in cell wall biosynthesis